VGNVLEVTFQDSAGRTFKLSKDDVRCLGNISGVKNMSRCFEIFDASGQTQPSTSTTTGNGTATGNNNNTPKVDYSVFDGNNVSTSQTITVMTQDGPVEVSGSVTCITSAGTQTLGQQLTVPGTNVGGNQQTPTVTVGTSIGMVGSGHGWIITGRGNGHNVGLSQCGALAMAKLGYGYLDILKYYFTGIEVY